VFLISEIDVADGKSSKGESFLKGTFVLTIAGFVVKVIGSLNWIFVSRILGGEGIGLYQMAFPIYFFAMTVSQTGVPVAISIITAERVALHDIYGAKRVFRTSMMFMLLTGLIFSVLTYLAADWLIDWQLIRDAGIKAGIALNPATPLDVLDYIAPELDYVLLMLINPGYAGSVGEGRVAYAAQKIRDCRRKLDTHESRARIVIDGRVSFDVIPALTEAGADVLVGGSGSVFRSGYTYAENCSALREMLSSIH